MDPNKVQAVVDLPEPCSAQAVHEFLGLARYYCKFVKEFGTIVAPLTALLKKEGFSWIEVVGATFNEIKATVITAPVLALPDFP